MKRLLTAIIAILYFTISSGFVVNLHYCMGKLRAQKVAVSAKKMCACKKAEDKKGCCKTTYKVIKLDDKHQISSIAFNVLTPVIYLPVRQMDVSAVLLQESEKLQAYAANAPPQEQAPLNVLYCVFRI